MKSKINNIFLHFESLGETELSFLLREFENEITPWLSSPPVNLLIESYFISTNNIEIEKFSEEPSIIINLAALINGLLISIPDTNEQRFKIIKSALISTLTSLIKKLVILSDHQISKLLFSIKDVFKKIVGLENEYNVYILELPIGNSIPCKILKQLLENEGHKTEIILISVNRNDQKKLGATRKELLLKIPNNPSNLIVFMDEWVTGSNFNSIIELLNKNNNSRLLPAAFLTANSDKVEKYNKYVEFHDKVVSKNGFIGAELRYEFAELNQKIKAQKFVWVEHDRLAGYRKFEFYGALFSTIKKTIEDFKQQPEVFDNELNIRTMGFETSKLKPDFIESIDYFIEHFSDALECKLLEVSSSNQKIDTDEDTKNFLKIVESTEGYENAKLGIGLACTYLRDNNINPYERYKFIGHVPMCEPLSSEERMLHDIFMAECLNKIST